MAPVTVRRPTTTLTTLVEAENIVHSPRSPPMTILLVATTSTGPIPPSRMGMAGGLVWGCTGTITALARTARTCTAQARTARTRTARTCTARVMADTVIRAIRVPFGCGGTAVAVMLILIRIAALARVGPWTQHCGRTKLE